MTKQIIARGFWAPVVTGSRGKKYILTGAIATTKAMVYERLLKDMPPILEDESAEIARVYVATEEGG